MINKIKTTAPVSSVGADGEQPINKNSNEIIANETAQINLQATKNNRTDANCPEKSGQGGGLQTVSMTELYDTVYPPRTPVVDGFLYGGTYLFVGAPKVGKSFFMEQLAYHVAMGLPLWNYPVRKGTVLYLALEDDYARLQRRLSVMFGVECADNLFFATQAKTLNEGLDGELEGFIEWEKKGTHEKHLSVLDFEKKERAKEVAELEREISGSKEELSDIFHQQVTAEQKAEQIRKESEAIRQKVSELSATNHLLKEQTETLTEDREKLLSENEKLEKQQKKLQQELNKMVQSKEVMERNIHAYDEDVKWQLAEPGALMSAKSYRDKKALPLVEKLKEIVKSLTIKCVQLTEQGKKLTAKVNGQQTQISRLTDKVMEQSDTIDRLQEKAADLGRLERHLGREQVWNGQRHWSS